jgi:hypothetical protein
VTVNIQQALGNIPAGIKLLEAIVEDDAAAIEGFAYKELLVGMAKFTFPLLELLPTRWRFPKDLYIDLAHDPSWPAGVLDQGALNSCVDNSVSTCLSVVSAKTWGQPFRASRLFLYGNARGWTTNDGCTTIGACAKGARTYGVPNERVWPYDVTKFAQRPPQSVWDAALMHKLTQSYWTLSLGSILHSLQQGYPVSFCTYLFHSFSTMDDAQGWVMPKPQPGEPLLGGHCMTVRGIDLAKGLALIQNSWGEEWGAGSQGHVDPATSKPGPALKGCFWMPLDLLCSPTLCSGWRTFRGVVNAQ